MKFTLIVLSLLLIGVTSCHKKQLAKTGTFYGTYRVDSDSTELDTAISCSCVLSYEEKKYSLTSTDCSIKDQNGNYIIMPPFEDFMDIPKKSLKDDYYHRKTTTSTSSFLFTFSSSSIYQYLTLKDNTILYETRPSVGSTSYIFEGSK